MESLSKWYEEYKHTCTCGNNHYPLSTGKFMIENGALEGLRSFLLENNYSNVLLVCDENTRLAVGGKVDGFLQEAGITVKTSLLPKDEQGDVIANELSIVHVQVDADKETEVMIAVGAGTIHDITRFASFKMGLPFISVPSAPSVDGFNSMGAPIVLRKKKLTFQTHAPIALFADLNVLSQAPQTMVAAGFADMLGKYTSLADWKFSHLVGEEPYCDAAAQMTEEALQSCLNHIDLIAQKNPQGLKYLMVALIQSGLAMSLFGHSHPASGGEHHLSHFWEMRFLEENRKQLLHGEKVGVSAGLIADYYKNETADVLKGDRNINSDKLAEILDEIPKGDFLRDCLIKVGGKTTLNELGVEDQLFRESLAKAQLIRERMTMLRVYNDIKSP